MDKRRSRISLSLKQLEADPVVGTIEDLLPPGGEAIQSGSLSSMDQTQEGLVEGLGYICRCVS